MYLSSRFNIAYIILIAQLQYFQHHINQVNLKNTSNQNDFILNINIFETKYQRVIKENCRLL